LADHGKEKPGSTPGFPVLSVVIGDPLSDGTLQCRAFMPSLHILKRRPAQVCDVGLLALPYAVLFDVDRLSEVPACAFFSPVITRNRWRPGLAFLAWHSGCFTASLLCRLSPLFRRVCGLVVTGNRLDVLRRQKRQKPRSISPGQRDLGRGQIWLRL